MSLSAIVLDLGNVLVFHDNQKLFADLGRLFGETGGALRARLDGGLWERVNRGQLPGDALRRELVARLGVEVAQADFEAAWSGHFTVHEAMVREVEGLVGRARLVLLSNTHDLHVRWCRAQVPLLERFDALVLSCSEGLMKPEAPIYARALAEAGVAPEAAVFFDDVEAYARGAAQVGMHGRVFRDVEGFRADLAALDARFGGRG